MSSNEIKNPGEAHNELTPLVRKGVNLMALAIRNFMLYPESNSIRIQSMGNLHQWLVRYLSENDSLRLTVEKDWLLFGKDMVYQDKSDEQPLVAPLFRDGIQWFEFLEGLTVEELGAFIEFICRFRTLKEEAEDDLATCLWDANLEHIKHKTADDFWEIDPMMEINALTTLIDNSSDENAANIAAHIQAGSKTVGLVLEAFNKIENKPQSESSGGGSAGLAPGQGGAAGQRVDLEAGPGGSGGPGGIPGTGGAGSGGAGAPGGGGGGSLQPAAEAGQHGPLAPYEEGEGEGEGQEMSELFAELLAGLEGSIFPKQKKVLSGAMTIDGAIKLRTGSHQPVYVDMSDAAEGSQASRTSDLLEGDDENGTPTDAAMAEAMFKVSTYFDTQGESPFWRLTQAECRHLRNLVLTEERRSAAGDCLAILRILLHSVSSQEERLEVVDFIAEEARYALGCGDVRFFRHFLEQLHREAQEMEQNPKVGDKWLGAFLGELNGKLMSVEILGVLAEPMEPSALNDEYLEDLRYFLLLLPAQAAFVLCPIIQKTPYPKLENALLWVAAVESGHLAEDLSPLIGALKPSSILDFLKMIEEGNLPISQPLFLGLTRNETPAVRGEAARILLNSNPDHIRRLVHLVTDAELSINKMICSQMSQSRNFQAERILLDHISEMNSRGGDFGKGHILNCYRAFGQCASAHTIAFLEDILMRKNLLSFLGLEGGWHAVGAAMALMLMPKEWGTREILQRAAQSRFRNIRQAYETAIQELPLGWKMEDDD